MNRDQLKDGDHVSYLTLLTAVVDYYNISHNCVASQSAHISWGGYFSIDGFIDSARPWMTSGIWRKVRYEIQTGWSSDVCVYSFNLNDETHSEACHGSSRNRSTRLLRSMFDLWSGDSSTYADVHPDSGISTCLFTSASILWIVMYRPHDSWSTPSVRGWMIR